MQFKIPQDVQMEDKIVGPLTLKQLVIVAAGGGLAYFIYVALAKLYILEVSIAFAAPVMLLTLAIAFLKIHGISFTQYVFLSIEFYTKPRQRIWNQGSGEVFISITSPTPKSKNQKKQDKQAKSAPKDLNSIGELTQSIDSYSELLDAKHEKLKDIIQNPPSSPNA